MPENLGDAMLLVPRAIPLVLHRPSQFAHGKHQVFGAGRGVIRERLVIGRTGVHGAAYAIHALADARELSKQGVGTGAMFLEVLSTGLRDVIALAIAVGLNGGVADFLEVG